MKLTHGMALRLQAGLVLGPMLFSGCSSAQRKATAHSPGLVEDYEKARQTLAECLDLAQNCYAAHLEATRRVFNQAFFSKIYIDEDNTVHFDYKPPFDQLLDHTIPASLRHRRGNLRPASTHRRG